MIGKDPLLSRAALDALLAQSEEGAADVVVGALDFLALDPSSLTRAIRGLLDLLEIKPGWRPQDKTKMERALAASLSAGTPWEKARAIRLAGLLGLEGLRKQAEVLAEGEAGPERIEAVEALGKMQGEPSKFLLESLLKDPDADIVEKARQALDRGRKA